MRYFEEHRRKLIKDKATIGAPATVKGTGNAKLCLNKCSGKFAKLVIYGKTEQEVATSTAYYSFNFSSQYYGTVDIFGDGTTFYLYKEGCSILPSGFITEIYVPRGALSENARIVVAPTYENLESGTNITELIYDSTNETFVSPSFTGKGVCYFATTDLSGFTAHASIYVTEHNPFNPAPIVNTGDNGIDVELSGVNLINLKDQTKNFDGSTQVTTQINPKFALSPSTTYTLSFDYEFSNINGTPSFDIGRGADWYTRDIKQGICYPNNTKGTFVYTFSLPSNLGAQSNLFFRIRRENTGQNYTVSISNWQLVIDSEIKSYQPYFTPVTVNIPSEVTLTDGTVVPLRFAKLGTVNNVAINKADTLTIDRGKVTYTQYLDVYQPQSPYVSAVPYYDYSGIGVRFRTTLPKTMTRRKGICSHGGKVGDYFERLGVWIGVNGTAVWWQGIVSILGFNSNWANKTSPTNEEKTEAISQMNNYFAIQEANGTPFQVLYELPTPIEYDLTETDLGQQLLALVVPYSCDGVLKVTGKELSISALQCEYYTIDDTLEDKLCLTVHYQDTEGQELAPTRELYLRKGTSYMIVPVDIEGYIPTDTAFEGAIKEDTEIIITYLGGSNESI